MFWRLFITYQLLATAAVSLAGILILQSVGRELFWVIAVDVATSVGIVIVLSIIPAYLMARRFTQPLETLMVSAQQLADGDLTTRIYTAGSQEVSSLANTLNSMSTKLAGSFSQLQHDKEQLRTILSGMVEGVIAFDSEQRILFANDRAAQLLEFQSDQAVGRKLWEITRQRAVQEAALIGLRGQGPYREELDWKGVTEKSLAVYVSCLPGPNSPGAVMVLHDISEIRRLERLRQDFVANVSHELKTPLANIKSSVEVLLDGAANEHATLMMFLAEIDIQANRLDALVADLLSLARIESGEAGLEFEVVLVEEAVHTCLDRHRTRAEVKGLTLNGVALVGCPPDLGVWADEEALAQILDNLVDNAIKYTPNDGRITVRWEASDQQVCFEVEDTGIGIPDRDLPRVFERFYRVDKARSRQMGGTGLGLSIVKHLTQAMKGTVRVTSQVERGTTFRICLPRAIER